MESTWALRGKKEALLMKSFTVIQVWVKEFAMCTIFVKVDESHLETAETRLLKTPKYNTLPVSYS